MRKIDKPIKVIFVGISNEYPHLTKLVTSLPSTHNVFFTGEIANEEVLHHYPLFTIKILPSDMEGLSQSILEAMALSVPVIATNASGNPDLIEHGTTGFLFEDSDIDQLAGLIQQLIGNEQLRDSVAREASRVVKNQYSMKEIVRQYEEFLRCS